jgi:hypothetical protein
MYPPPAKDRERSKNPMRPSGETSTHSDMVEENSTSRRILVSRVGLKIPPDTSFEDWELAGKRLFGIADSAAWCLGDWLVYGEEKYQDRYRRAIAAANLDYQTLRNYAWVARKFSTDRRRPGLSFQHHAEVASLPADQQDELLDQAEKWKWSRNQLRRQVRHPRADAEKSKHEMQLSIPRVIVEREKIDRWLRAAARSSIELEVWIVSTLDRAASEELAQQVENLMSGDNDQAHFGPGN